MAKYDFDDEEEVQPADDAADQPSTSDEDALDASTPDDDSEIPPLEEREAAGQHEKIQKDLQDESNDVESELAASEPKEGPAEKAPSKESDLMQQLAMIKAAQAPQHPPLNQYQDFLKQYQALQHQRQNSDLVAGLAAAGGKIGQSMAGRFSGNFTPDPTGPNLIRQMGERPVQDFEQAQVVQGRGMQLQSQMAASDPTSPQSRLVRDYLNKRLGVTLPDDVSANDAMMLMKTMGKPQTTHFSQLPMVNKNSGEKLQATFNPTTQQFESGGRILNPQEWVRDYRAQSFVDPYSHERVGFGAGTGKVTGPLTGPGVNRPGVPSAENGQPVQFNRSMLTAAQAKQLDQTRKTFETDVKDDRNALNATNRIIDVLNKGEELGGDLPREIQDQLNRAFGQKGHISDAQLGGLLGKPDWKNRLENAVSLGAKGELTDENRQFLLDLANVIKKQNVQFIQNKSQIHVGNLARDLKSDPRLKGIKPSDVNSMLGVPEAAFQGIPADRVHVVSPDGQEGHIPKAQVEAAKKQGYKVLNDE